MECPNCGADLGENYVCPYCGYENENAAEAKHYEEISGIYLKIAELLHTPVEKTRKITKALIIGTIAILCIFLVGFLIAVVYSVSGVHDNIPKADAINQCERHYHERNFSKLQDVLTLYDLYDETYGVYWEAVEGYNTLVRYYQWNKADKMEIEGARQEAQSQYDALNKMAQKPKFSKNTKLFKGFVEKAQSGENG